MMFGGFLTLYHKKRLHLFKKTYINNIYKDYILRLYRFQDYIKYISKYMFKICCPSNQPQLSVASNSTHCIWSWFCGAEFLRAVSGVIYVAEWSVVPPGLGCLGGLTRLPFHSAGCGLCLSAWMSPWDGGLGGCSEQPVRPHLVRRNSIRICTDQSRSCAQCGVTVEGDKIAGSCDSPEVVTGAPTSVLYSSRHNLTLTEECRSDLLCAWTLETNACQESHVSSLWLLGLSERFKSATGVMHFTSICAE